MTSRAWARSRSPSCLRDKAHGTCFALEIATFLGVLKMAVRNDVRHLSGSGAVACGSRGLPESFVQCLGIGGGFAALGVGCRRVVGVSWF